MAITRMTQTTGTYDLTSRVKVLDYTPDVAEPRYVKLLLQVGDVTNGLNNGGDISLEIWIGGIQLDGISQTKSVAAGITRVVFLSNELIVPPDDVVEIFVASSDPADTNVRVIAEAYDVPTGNVIEISGDSTAADNLESYCDGTAVQSVNATQISGSTPNNISVDEVNAQCDQSLADAGVTSTRMSYVDNLNIGENVAGTSEVTSITNNTRCVRVVPCIIQRPDSGSTTCRVELLLYDETGNMESPDAAPTITLVNQAGADRSSRLDSATMAHVSTGRYRAIYTADSSDALEQLVWTFAVTEGGVARSYGNSTLVVDTVAVDFTSADRTKLEAIHGKLPSKSYLTGSTDADGGIDATESAEIRTQVDASTAALNDPSVDEIADAVWDESQVAHTGVGTFGSFLDAQVSDDSGGGSWTAVLPWAVRMFRDGSASAAYLTAYQAANLSVSLDLVDADDLPIDLSGVDLLFVAWEEDAADVPIVSLKNYDGRTDIVVSGDEGNHVTLSGGASQLTAVGRLVWCLRNKTTDTVVAEGTLDVRPAADLN